VRLDLVNAAQWQEPPADRLCEVRLRAPLLGAERLLQDVAQLGFHRPAVPGGAHTQFFPQFGIDIADGQRRHSGSRINTPSLYAMHGVGDNRSRGTKVSRPT
jgi:hypothetical protein